MSGDPWLERWLPEIRKRSSQRSVLELGCGWCEDTVFLERQGLRVVAADVSAGNLANCARKTRRAALVCLDLRSRLPCCDGSFGVILASLCLHYFEWGVTLDMVQEIRRCMVHEGLLLCRLNSTKDVYFGAEGHPLVALPGEGAYYQVGHRRKRFFDEEAVRNLFADGWNFASLEEQTIGRYARPKTAWEAALRKAPRA